MRLSKLHIAGFKSFPDRAELGFDDGVTAIVGPNGCGKSNVVDAITWVLGEQSAKSLRGERMEDVIFNGSEARKPTAAAEVRLKFTQVTETVAPPAAIEGEAQPLLDEQPVITRDVEIGRRLYRSGESEYLIDGAVCRLRDIHDLLMDSGLGVKAYAVIEQGKIGQILSSRPAERRMLIEEAAGVTKYKSRRRAAELKLEAAEHNLTRVEDIVFEVEKQRAALKRQAARARRYRRLREELRKWEQVQFARRHEALSAEITRVDARLADAHAREAAASARVSELDVALESLRLGLTEAEARASESREHAHARELSIGRREQQIAFARQQLDELARQRAAFAVEAAALEERRGPALDAIETQRVTASEARSALEGARARVTDSETDYARALAAVQAVEREADETRGVVLGASATLSALSQARDHAAAARDRVAADRERLELEAREIEAEAARLRAASAETARAVEEARRARDEAARDRAAAEGVLAQLRLDRDAQQTALAAREREVAGLEARLGSLEDLVHQRATFGDGARFLLSDAGDAFRHRGAVADHLAVERSYERAVDALLGDLLQHILVEHADDVSAALALMADRRSGRCGFAVLEDAVAAVDPRPLVVPPGARALADVVRASGPDAERIAKLLPAALIVESYDVARALARTVAVPVATTSGVVCRGAWLVEGGSHREARGILETRAQIESLRDEITIAGGASRDLQRAIAELDRQIADVQARGEALVADQHEREKSIVGLEAQVVRLADETERAARRLDVVATDCAKAAEEHEASDRRQTDAVAAIGTHEQQMRLAEENLGQVMARLQQTRETAEASLRVVTTMRTEEATLVERASGFDAELARLEATLADLVERLASRRADIDRIDLRNVELQQSIESNTQALDEDVRVLDELKSSLRTADERVSGLRIEFGEREQEIRGARGVLDGVRSEVMQSEVARANAASDLTHLGVTVLETFGISIEEVSAEVSRMAAAGELSGATARVAAADVDEDVDGASDDTRETADGAPEEAAAGDPEQLSAAAEAGVADADAVIGELRAKIDKLGPVNMMAIEQFDELESRHAFLVAQRKDLVDSIAQTGEAIKRIDKTTHERFADAFQVINLHFEKTFTTLFGGGRAGLVLIDAENDNESGIDIIAQPPGKRLQNVQLLSGGEKALTAMALMFAVFKHRPSPFCLLDEIDAPLDDANIGRFVEMLQGMQEHTQFILITHNRRTMEIADRLYGVTMEEPGVSRLISLQLN
jgi:chromosome segregation protein